ncbi:MAG: hypothetical protein ABR527_11180 [Gemmatimonadota bacterium]
MPGSSRRRRRSAVGRGILVALLLAVAPAAQVAAQSQPVREDGVTLEQNFPNPFTPGVSPTIFTYTLPDESHVRLAVYNLLAQEVALLLDETKPKGRHRVAWDGNDAHRRPVPAGVYWYRLEVGDRRPLLMRLRVRESAPAESPGLAAERD